MTRHGKDDLAKQLPACPARRFQKPEADVKIEKLVLVAAPGFPWRFPKPKWRNWQTRMVQVHVPARVWGFESLLRHQARARGPSPSLRISPAGSRSAHACKTAQVQVHVPARVW